MKHETNLLSFILPRNFKQNIFSEQFLIYKLPHSSFLSMKSVPMPNDTLPMCAPGGNCHTYKLSLGRNKWTKLDDLPEVKLNFAAAVINGIFYVVG